MKANDLVIDDQSSNIEKEIEDILDRRFGFRPFKTGLFDRNDNKPFHLTCFVGPPCCGKGTLLGNIESNVELTYPFNDMFLSMSDLLNKKKLIDDHNKLVNCYQVNDALCKEMTGSSRRRLIDGFPRSEVQARLLATAPDFEISNLLVVEFVYSGINSENYLKLLQKRDEERYQKTGRPTSDIQKRLFDYEIEIRKIRKILDENTKRITVIEIKFDESSEAGGIFGQFCEKVGCNLYD